MLGSFAVERIYGNPLLFLAAIPVFPTTPAKSNGTPVEKTAVHPSFTDRSTRSDQRELPLHWGGTRGLTRKRLRPHCTPKNHPLKITFGDARRIDEKSRSVFVLSDSSARMHIRGTAWILWKIHKPNVELTKPAA
jgi:hypothetical protein